MTKLFKSLFALLVSSVLLCGCLHMPMRHDFGNYSNAERFYSEGKYQKAIESYQKYIDEQPEGNLAIVAKYYIAKSYAALNEKDKAKTGFEAIAQQYPDLIWAELSKEQIKNL